MKDFLKIVVIGIFCLLPLSNVMAEQVEAPQSYNRAQFFSSLHDVPLMSGLVELPDQTVIFDKPEGRIIEAVAQINRLSEDEIRGYYESVLPKLGWSKIGDNSFVRGSEGLNMSFETYEEQKFLRMIVTPR